MRLAAWLPWLAPVAGAATYGLGVRWIATGDSPLGPAAEWAMGVMGFAFLFFVPFAMGFMCTRWAPVKSLQGALGLSLLPGLLVVVATIFLRWEGAICVVIGIIPLSGMSMLGGALGFHQRRTSKRDATLPALVLPFLLAPIEGRIDLPQAPRVVASSIEIDASPAVVWAHIERVPAIAPHELRPSLASRMGFPAPVEATLDREGVGGVRRATFEGGVLFLETITEWDEPRVLSFAIDAQTETIPPTTLDEHVTIGGPFFDVLQGTYRIEPIDPGTDGRPRVRLHLESRLRVSTHLNVYANPWADAIMKSIQDQILLVLKNRCEGTTRGAR